MSTIWDFSVPVRICHALTSDGTPCKRPTIRGGTRCSLHGGNSPNARRVAQELLIGMRVPALRVLNEIIERYNATRCEHCGRGDDPSMILRAVTIVLDRSGLHPSMALEVTPVTHDDAAPGLTAWIPTERLVTMRAWYAEAQARMEAGEPPLVDLDDGADVIDVEPTQSSETTH
jgi:hypothetical protein